MRPEKVESKKAIKAGKSGEPPFGWDCIDLKNIDLKNPGTTTLPHGGVVEHVGTIDLHVVILPLRHDAPIYMAAATRPDFSHAASVTVLQIVEIIPRYQWQLTAR